MNREQANAWRVAHGLPPMVSDAAAAQRKAKQQRANKAAHAQLQRDIRNARSRKGK